MRNFVFFPRAPLQLLTHSLREGAAGLTKHVHFRVPPALSKVEIKGLLTHVYGLQVVAVDTVNRLGKSRRVGVSRVRQPVWTKRPDWKRARVELRVPVDTEVLRRFLPESAPRPPNVLAREKRLEEAAQKQQQQQQGKGKG